MPNDRHFKRYHDHILREGLLSSLSIGLIYRDKGIGILRLYSKRPRRFSSADISLARTVASQSAAAIINARLYAQALEGERMARQLRLAGTVQRHLIPAEPPELPGFDLAGLYVPCYDVGGDFYDFITLADHRLLLVMGDVMGKGVPASLAMASLRSSLRAYTEHVTQPDALVRHANRMFCNDISSGEFATLFCAVVDLDSAVLTYCNCGHDPPLLLRGSETINLTAGGTVLGIDKNSFYTTESIQLKPQDMLVIYTDGLADAMNFQREPFGRQRIIEAFQASAEMTADGAAHNVLWLMRKFTGLTKRFDDTAIVILKKL